MGRWNTDCSASGLKLRHADGATCRNFFYAPMFAPIFAEGDRTSLAKMTAAHERWRQPLHCPHVFKRGNGGLDRAAGTQAPVSTDGFDGDSIRDRNLARSMARYAVVRVAGGLRCVFDWLVAGEKPAACHR